MTHRTDGMWGREMRSGGYGELIEGVHTWDVATIFEDMRTLLRAASKHVKPEPKS